MKTMLRSAAILSGCWIALAPATAIAQPGVGGETHTVTTFQTRDLNGTAAAAAQVVEQHTRTSDGEQVLIDVYVPSVEAGRLALTRRVRRVTTATSNGSRKIEEVEERNPVAPGDPMRIVRRTVTNVRATGPNSEITDHQVFERDVNDRLVPVFRQVDDTSRR